MNSNHILKKTDNKMENRSPQIPPETKKIMDDSYNVIFEGNIKQGENPLEVKRNLAALFKVDLMRIEKIFLRSPAVIKRDLPREKALKYIRAIDHAGALCRIEKTIPTSHDQVNQPTNSEKIALQKVQAVPLSINSGAGLIADPKKQSSEFMDSSSQKSSGINIMDKDTLKILGIGFAIFIMVILVPFLSYIFHYLITLVHELGHTIFGLIFGYFSVPAFDFVYGGGVTIHTDQSMGSLIFVYLFLGWLLYFYRRNRLTIFIILGVLLLYSLAAFTSAHQVVILFMGHGTELVFAGIFLYRALSGSSVVVSAERPLYAFLAFFIFFKDFRFAYDLMYSPVFQAEYAAAKGGGHWMDFSRIAREFFHVELSTVAGFFLFICVVTPVLTFLFFRYKPQLNKVFRRVLSPVL